MLDYKAVMTNVQQKIAEKTKAGIIETTYNSVQFKTSKSDLRLLESPQNPIPYDSINNFYRNFGHCHIDWRLTDDYWNKIKDEICLYLAGYINIYAFRNVVKPYIKNGKDSYGYTTMSGGLENYSSSFPIPKDITFHNIAYIQDRGHVGFFIGEGYNEELWFTNLHNRFEPMGCTIDDYFLSLSKDYGVIEWHIFYEDFMLEMVMG